MARDIIGDYVKSNPAGDTESFSTKALRELEFVAKGTIAGFATGAEESLNDPMGTLFRVGTAAGLSGGLQMLSRRGNAGAMLARSIGSAMTAAFANDLLLNSGNLQRISGSLGSVWESRENFDNHVTTFKDDFGRFAFDNALLTLAGIGGAKVAQRYGFGKNPLPSVFVSHEAKPTLSELDPSRVRLLAESHKVLNPALQTATEVSCPKGLSMYEYETRRRAGALAGERIKVRTVDETLTPYIREDGNEFRAAGKTGTIISTRSDAWDPHSTSLVWVNHDDGTAAAYAPRTELVPETLRSAIKVDESMLLPRCDRPLKLHAGDVIVTHQRLDQLRGMQQDRLGGVVELIPEGSRKHGYRLPARVFARNSQIVLQDSGIPKLSASTGDAVEVLSFIPNSGMPPGRFHIGECKIYIRPPNELTEIHGEFKVLNVSKQGAMLQQHFVGDEVGSEQQFFVKQKFLNENYAVKRQPLDLRPGDEVAIPFLSLSESPALRRDGQFMNMSGLKWDVLTETPDGAVLSHADRHIAVPRKYLQEPYVFKAADLDARLKLKR